MPIQFDEVTAELLSPGPATSAPPASATTIPASSTVLAEAELREALRRLAQREARLSDA